MVDSDSNRLTAGAVAGLVTDARTARSEGNLGLAATLGAASYDGTAKFGELFGTASAQAIGGVAIGQVSLRWDDDYIATSSTLPFGAAVDYLFTMTLDSGIFTSVHCDGSVSPPGPAAASLVGNNGAAGMIVDRACPGPPDDRSISTVLHTTIGARSLISGELTLGASVGSSAFGLPDVFATIDASHTGRFYLDPIGDDHSYRTGSGTSYSSPIPEPGTCLLLGLGLAALAQRARSRARATLGR